MSGKKERQAAIRGILSGSDGTTQEKIKSRLEKNGIIASQATLSRDLREMGAVKIPVENGGAVYRLGNAHNFDEIGGAMRTFASKFDVVGNFLVINTGPGNAPGLCAVLDRQGWKEIVGTIAGDDTILVIARTVEDVETIVYNLEVSLGEGIQ